MYATFCSIFYTSYCCVSQMVTYMWDTEHQLVHGKQHLVVYVLVAGILLISHGMTRTEWLSTSTTFRELGFRSVEPKTFVKLLNVSVVVSTYTFEFWNIFVRKRNSKVNQQTTGIICAPVQYPEIRELTAPDYHCYLQL